MIDKKWKISYKSVGWCSNGSAWNKQYTNKGEWYHSTFPTQPYESRFRRCTMQQISTSSYYVCIRMDWFCITGTMDTISQPYLHTVYSTANPFYLSVIPLWNSLPPSIFETTSITSFKHRLRHFFITAWPISISTTALPIFILFLSLPGLSSPLL